MRMKAIEVKERGGKFVFVDKEVPEVIGVVDQLGAGVTAGDSQASEDTLQFSVLTVRVR